MTKLDSRCLGQLVSRLLFICVAPVDYWTTGVSSSTHTIVQVLRILFVVTVWRTDAYIALRSAKTR